MTEISLTKSPETDETVSFTELAAFVGHTQFQKAWELYRDKKSFHAGFNGWAAIFGIQWFVVRRLYWQGLYTGILEVSIPVCMYLFLIDFLGKENYEGNQIAVHLAVALSALLVRIVIGFVANIALFKKAGR